MSGIGPRPTLASAILRPSLGIKNGSNKILEQIKNVLTVEQVREQAQMIARACKTRSLGLFVMGFSEGTREDIETIIEFPGSIPLYLAVFSPQRPAPGT